jgi:hypothetical protein
MPGSQEHIDRFYFAHGKCCAGCDWWRHINSVAGMCARMPVEEHTTRGHVCGEFKDEFDWSSLPPNYRRMVGDPNAPARR